MQVKEFPPDSKKKQSKESIIREAIARHSLSIHAIERMQQRGISNEAVFQTIAFGRITRGRGATIYAIGKKEVGEYAKQGIDLSYCEGVHVVMNRRGTVSTVYRNLSMPKIKPRRRMPERIFKQNLPKTNARGRFVLLAHF